MKFLYYLFLFIVPFCESIDHVIHIGIDGLNPLCIENSSNGGINMAVRLAMEGSSTFINARTIIETVSAPGWTATLCSMTSVTSGVHSNAWVPPWPPFCTRQPITPVTGNDVPLPTVFSVLKAQNNSIQTAMIYDWNWLSYLGNKSIPGSVDYEVTADQVGGRANSNGIIKEALNYLNNVINVNQPSYTFIYFDSVDVAGHNYGWCSKEYADEVGVIDTYVGQILDTVDRVFPKDAVLVMLSSDHGGKPGTFNHGYANDECLHIPLLLMGSGVRKNHHIESPVMNLDLAPTALYMMGLKPHWAWEGKVIHEALEKEEVTTELPL